MKDQIIRVLLVDDQDLVRFGVRKMIDSDPAIEVAGEAADGAEAISISKEGEVDVVLMDLAMPNVDGVVATRRIMEMPNPPRVLILTTFDADEKVAAALNAGAIGFLLKYATREQLLAGIRTAFHGDAVMAVDVMRQVAAKIGRSASQREIKARAQIAALTERERDILKLIAAGKTNKEISAEQFMAMSTVKNYVSRVLSNLGVENRTQAAQLAHDAGLSREEPGL